ncbi:FtsX-like permease family protein [Rhodococcus sp. D2-41]|uniref:FtsX-like permease family protein n=1 Tax=Speluncibacter jeojiensis TaxID=2710754 RepID=A0A9X4LWI5_9ACTN|nr:FtsX-like permease family protein [Rhodococcus sp. D2-41]MDG3012111.1 FtsX-like permease family protein [Rhodococcus sp. D2-41]MDG3013635.1 FtsX-like permease family protein [Corynebacteriales bacterium D3-21]
MRRVSLRNLAAHKVRLVLTVLSVVLGTAFVTGSFVFTDTLHSTFNGIFANTTQNVDVQVSAKDTWAVGVPNEDVAKIKALPNVRVVDPQISGQIVLIGSDGTPVRSGGAPSIGLAYQPPEQTLAQPMHIVSGTAPQQPGQIVLNEGAASLAGIQAGGHAKILVPTVGMQDVTVTGIYSMSTDTGGFVGAAFTEAQARSLFTDGRHVRSVDVAGSDGISQTALRDEIAKALPTLDVKTADQVRSENQQTIDNALKFVNYFLLAFGAIALLVGTFIIYNTFSMIVAQRLRELALLRAIGASREQVSRSVLLEAVIVGLIGSVVGLGVGVGLAYGLRALLNAFHLGIPSGPLDLEPRTVVLALVVGIVVTVVSAYAPARRAARIPPVAAMREEHASAAGTLHRRTIAGAVLGVVGIAGIIAGVLSTSTGPAATFVGIGAFCLIIAVLLAAPAMALPVVRALGAVLTAPFGAIGRLARTNAVRNPRRTAATAFALTLGLMLVTTIAVFGASARASVDQQVNHGVTADFILSGPNTVGVPVGAATAAAKVDGVSQTVQFHPTRVKLDGKTVGGLGVDGDLTAGLRVEMASGKADLTGSGMIVSESAAAEHHWGLGTSVTMTGANGSPVASTVTGIFRDNQLLGDWVLGPQSYHRLTPSISVVDSVVLITTATGVDQPAVQAKLQKAVDPFVVVQVLDKDQFKGQQGQQIDSLLAILYGLLALAIVIAILGIINTLALSVVERRREIGILRAVGMQRFQVRRAIYLESMLIALFGAAVGIVLGLVFGAAFVHTLRSSGLDTISIPWGQAVAMLVGSAVVGVVAALWPGVRAARTRPLEAIADL